jgi:hypothetical protein
MSKKNLTWGDNTSSYSSGINHGYQDSTQGRKAQQLENSAQAMFGKTGDERFLRHIGDAPSGRESMNLIENSGEGKGKGKGKKWGGKKTKRAYKKTKRAYKKTKRAYKKTKRAHKKKIHRKH